MTNIWTDEAELDSVEDGEGLYDNEGEAYDEESRSEGRRRRERARRIAQARQRAGGRRGQLVGTSPQPTAQPTAQRAVRAVENLDVETKVAQDEFRRAIAAVNKRADRGNWATVGALLVSQGIATFGAPGNKIVEGVLRAAPLALLAPSPRGGGVGAILTDPRVVGLAGVVGLGVIDHQRTRSSAVRQVDALGPSQLAVGEQDVFLADVLDNGGQAVNTAVRWKSDNSTVAEIDETTGKVIARSAGVVVISAVVDNVVRRRVRLKVVPAAVRAGGRDAGDAPDGPAAPDAPAAPAAPPAPPAAPAAPAPANK